MRHLLLLVVSQTAAQPGSSLQVAGQEGWVLLVLGCCLGMANRGQQAQDEAGSTCLHLLVLLLLGMVHLCMHQAAAEAVVLALLLVLALVLVSGLVLGLASALQHGPCMLGLWTPGFQALLVTHLVTHHLLCTHTTAACTPQLALHQHQGLRWQQVDLQQQQQQQQQQHGVVSL
jgi:hypothetical protein